MSYKDPGTITFPGEPMDSDAQRLMLRFGCVHFLNTTILPAGVDGLWRVAEVDKSFVRHCISYMAHSGMIEFTASHIGHEATAVVANELLRLSPGQIAVDRTPWDGTGLAVALQLKGRIPEGAILTREQMEEIGYSFRMLYRADSAELQTALRPGLAAMTTLTELPSTE